MLADTVANASGSSAAPVLALEKHAIQRVVLKFGGWYRTGRFNHAKLMNG